MALVLILAGLIALIVIWAPSGPWVRCPGDPCHACGYALLGLPERGRCPECGTPYADGGEIGTRRCPAHPVRWTIGIVGALAVIVLAEPMAIGYTALFDVYAPNIEIASLGSYRMGCCRRGSNYAFITPLVMACLVWPAISCEGRPALAASLRIGGLLVAVALSLVIPLVQA